MTANEWLTNFMEGHRQENILCIYGPQGSGKSTLARMIALSLERNEVFHTNRAPSGYFSGAELEGKELAIYEEISDLWIENLKQWAASPKIGILRRGQDHYTVDNTTSFIVTRRNEWVERHNRRIINCGVIEGFAILTEILEQQARKD